MRSLRIAILLLMIGVSLRNATGLAEEIANRFDLLEDDASQLLNEFLIGVAGEQFDERRRKVAKALESPEGVRDYKESLRENYLALIERETKRTPLNARITGEVRVKGYRIERVLFESRPNHHVTGNLYLPSKQKGRLPAVLVPCGHSVNGKAAEPYQSLCALLALNGCVALIVDTYGQGERHQIRSTCGLSPMPSPTVRHTQLDIGSMLVGRDVVCYQAWDNVRAIDYLCSRPEVDQERIGVTGNSGGGTQTLYLAALDSRVRVAAPSCGLQTRERMFTLNGPADGCHHLPGEGRRMLEYADYLILCAPRPVLVLAGEKDSLFDINAVAFACREAKWFYKELGFLNHLDLFTANDKHGIGKELREADVWWFKKWFSHESAAVTEHGLVLQTDENLLVTKTGQVLSEFEEEESIVDKNLRLACSLGGRRSDFWQKSPKETQIAKLKSLLGFQEIRGDRKVASIERGETIEREFHIRKVVISNRDGFPLPTLLCIPEPRKLGLPVTLLLDPHGKNALFERGTDSPHLLEREKVIVGVDLRGQGETKDDPRGLRKHWTAWNDEHRIGQTSLHIGRPLLGQRVQDVIDVLDYLEETGTAGRNGVALVGTGHCGLVALHAAAIDPRIAEVTVVGTIPSWTELIREPLARNHLKNIVPNAMAHYDLADLIEAVKPRPVVVVDPVDAHGKAID